MLWLLMLLQSKSDDMFQVQQSPIKDTSPDIIFVQPPAAGDGIPWTAIGAVTAAIITIVGTYYVKSKFAKGGNTDDKVS